ncbi:MAG: hypothetical protein K2X64_00530 [Rhodocyclaceae bacterium]|nr:hypothetical protein [Rhodocyclaceae bacterium]
MLYDKDGKLYGYVDEEALDTDYYACQLSEADGDSIEERVLANSGLLIMYESCALGGFREVICGYAVRNIKGSAVRALHWKAVGALHRAGFEVMGTVVDGASNFRLWRKSLAVGGEDEDEYVYKCPHPYAPTWRDGSTRYYFLMADPSHTIRKLRNQLRQTDLKVGDFVH